MKKCPVCNQEQYDNALFCKNCGSKFDSLRICPDCHNEIATTARFCKHCGHQFTDISATQSIPVTDTMEIESTRQISATATNNIPLGNTQEIDSTSNINQKQFINTSPELNKVQNQDTNKKGGIGKFIILGAVLIAALAIGLFFFMNMKKTINMNDLINVRYEGEVSGYTTAYVDLDYEKLNKQLGDRTFKRLKDKLSDTFGSYASEMPSQSEYLFTYDPRVVNYVKNGDEINVKLEPLIAGLGIPSITNAEEFYQELGINQPETYKVVVSGLQDPTYIKLALDNIENYITFDGINGKGEARWTLPNDYSVDNQYYMTRDGYDSYRVVKNNNDLGYLIYQIITDNNGSLSNDDTVKVVIHPDDRLQAKLIEEKLGIENSSADVTVKGLGHLLNNVDEITAQDQFKLEELLLNTGYMSGDKLIHGYKAVLKPTEVSDSASNFELVLIGRKALNSYNRFTYYIYELKDLYRQDNGEIGCSSIYTNSYNFNEQIGDDRFGEMLNRFNLTKVDISPDHQTKIVGYFKVNVDKLRIRDAASTKATQLGHCNKGDIYEIYAIEENDGYTWYFIGDNRYVASKEGDWTTFMEDIGH